jgi:hypothetical protein
MLVTEFGMVTEVRPVQPENPHSSMLVTEYVFSLYSTWAGISNAPETVSFLLTLTVVSSIVVYFKFPIVKVSAIPGNRVKMNKMPKSNIFLNKK